MGLGFRLRRYAHLGRIMSAMLTAGIAMVGAYSTGHILTWQEFLVFMWLGFWFHSFGGVYNEYSDYKLDSMVPELKDKPMVSGDISFYQAMAFTMVTIFAGLLALAFFFPHTWAMVFWVLSYFAGGYYDAKGKYTPMMFEWALGFTFFFWALFGAAAVKPDFFDGITVNTIAVSVMIFMYAVYINWGNAMKDAPTDKNLNVPTRAVAWGYDFGQKLKWTSSHIVYALVIKLCLLFAFALPILTSKILPMMGYNISGITTLTGEPLLALPLLGDVDLYTLFFLFLVIPTQLFMVVHARGVHEREWWTKYIVIDIFFTWLAFAFMTVMVVDVLWSIFLFLLPFIWFAGTTTIMYGKPMRVGL